MGKNTDLDDMGFIDPGFDDETSVQEEIDNFAEEVAEKKTKKKSNSQNDKVGTTEKTKIPGIVKRYTQTGYVYDAIYYAGKETVFNQKKGCYVERVVRPKKTFATFKAAKDWLDKEKGNKAKRSIEKKSTVMKVYKISEVFPIYRQHCVDIGRSDSYLADYDRYHKRFKKYFVGKKDKYITDMDSGDITDYLTHEHNIKNYKYSSLEKLRSALSMTWEFLIEHSKTYNVTYNIAKHAKIHAPDNTHHANMLTHAQLHELIQEGCNYYDPTFLYLIVMSMFQSLRRGELAGLKWSDINFETNYVMIQHNRIQRLKGVKLPKMEKKRVIELHKAGRDVIDIYKKWQEDILGHEVDPDAFVMQWEVNLKNNYNPSVGKISRRWKEIYEQMNKNREKAGKERLSYGRLHDGRHIYLTHSTQGVKKEDGTIVMAANYIQAYMSAGHELPKALQNTSTQTYIEDVNVRWDVTRFWNAFIDIDIKELWEEKEKERKEYFENLPPIQQDLLKVRRQKEIEKALKEHLEHLKEDDEILQIRTDEGEYSTIDDDEDTDEE